MNRFIFYAITAAIALFFAFLIFNAKYAYKLLPVQTSPVLASEQFETWQPFTPPIKTFSVKFPVRPQYASERTMDAITKQPLYYDMYVAETLSGNKYMISTITYPDGAIKERDKDKLMTRVMQDMVSSNKENELAELSKGKYETFDALEFTVKTPQNNIRTKTFVDDDIIYILSGISPLNIDGQDEYDYFIDSFTLTQKQPVD